MRVPLWPLAALLAACFVAPPTDVRLHADPGLLDLARAELRAGVPMASLRLGNVGTDCVRVETVHLEGEAADVLSVAPPRPGRVLRPGDVLELAVRVERAPFHTISGRSAVVVAYGAPRGVDGCGTDDGAAGVLSVPIVAGLPALCDADGDGHLAQVCGGLDCDDTDPAVPAPFEVCNGVDDTCDGRVDVDAVDAPTWYVDVDGDGFGDPEGAVAACEPPEGHVADATDCDDADARVYPGAVETCDGVDEDCDGEIDEGFVRYRYHPDADEDGFGDLLTSVFACAAPPGHLRDGSDCDDDDPAVNPDADEICNGVDDDCDGRVDLDPVRGPSWYEDGDGDTWGAGAAVIACDQPEGWVARPGDCRDDLPDVYPGAPEYCNDIDDDGDGGEPMPDEDPGAAAYGHDLDAVRAGLADDAPVDGTPYFADDDGDGYGDDAIRTVSCTPVEGYVTLGGDCDDGDPDVNPGRAEICDAVDQDCDGLIDDGPNVCPCPVVHRGDSAYGLCDLATSWGLARTACQSAGYDLAWIDDAAEDTWLRGQVRSVSTGPWWIGLNDRETEGRWVWANGAAPTYTGWAAGRPNTGLNLQDCAQIGSVNGWSDALCLNFQPFVCKAAP